MGVQKSRQEQDPDLRAWLEKRESCTFEVVVEQEDDPYTGESLGDSIIRLPDSFKPGDHVRVTLEKIGFQREWEKIDHD